MRTIIAVVIALLLGLVAGMGLISYRADANLAAVRAERDQAQSEAARLRDEAEAQKRLVRMLESENAARNSRIETLERQATQALAAESGTDAQAAASPPEAAQEAAPPAFPFLFPDAREEEERPASEDDENPWRNPEFRSQMRENFRQGVNSFLTDRMTQSQDPLEQQRLATLAEYTDYLFDLRGQMRDAETPEAREALEQEYENAVAEARRVVDEQQRGMIARLGESYGINSPQQQEAFVQAVRNLMDDPILRSSRFMTGFRGGWGRPGDGPGRGMGPGMGPPMPF